MTTKPCDWCGDEVERPPSYFEKVDNAFCSKGCRSEWQSEFRSGENHPTYNGGKEVVDCDECGSDISRWPNSVGERNFCSIQCHADWYSKNLSGEDHPNYKYGARDDRFTDTEREQIYERDDYTCQDCGDDDGGNLNAHHIIPSADDRSKAHDIENGVTLCIECHAARHDEPVSSFILAQNS